MDEGNQKQKEELNQELLEVKVSSNDRVAGFHSENVTRGAKQALQKF